MNMLFMRHGCALGAHVSGNKDDVCLVFAFENLELSDYEREHSQSYLVVKKWQSRRHQAAGKAEGVHDLTPKTTCGSQKIRIQRNTVAKKINEIVQVSPFPLITVCFLHPI